MVGFPEGSLSLLSRFLIRHSVARLHRRMRDPPLEPTQNVSQNVSQDVEDATFEIIVEKCVEKTVVEKSSCLQLLPQ